MTATIISRILGFIREITLSYFYGASNISDAYLISQTIPTVIFGFIGAGLATAYIPMYSKIEKELGKKEADWFSSNLINVLMIIISVIFVVAFLFSEPIARLFASGFDGETLELASAFTRISLVGMFFNVLISLFSGYLQIKGKFMVPALIGLPFNVLVIISIIVSSQGNVFVMSIGTVVAIASQLLFMLPTMKKVRFQYQPAVNFKSEHMKSMLQMALPVFLGRSVNQINILVDKTIASGIAVGGISALNFANRLSQFVQGLFVISITTVIYPLISKMAVEGDVKNLKKAISESINTVNIVLLPATVGAMIFAEPIVRMLFGRGAFDEQAVVMTSQALFFLSIGMVGFGLREILTRAFYSLQDTKTPVVNATIGVGLNIVLNFILSRFLGIGGLALATSISATFTTVLLFISLRRKLGVLGLRKMVVTFVKILVASVVMGFIAKMSFGFLVGNLFGEIMSLILSIGAGAVVYFVIVSFMGIEDVEVILNSLRKRWRKF